jgi:hypothetical protein
MSKKLIAVASAAALALSALVATPASAGAFAVAVDGNVAGDGIASTTAYTVPVPSTDVIRYESAGADTSNTAVKLDVEVTATGGTATFTATGGVRLLNATQLADAETDTKTGTTTLSVTAAATEALAYAYNTSTTAGTVVVANGGNSQTIYIKGISAKAYKVTASGSSFASKGVDYEATVVVADMFGNPTTALTDASFTVTGLGAFASNITESGNIVETTTKGTYTITVPAAEVSATGTGLLQITTVAGDSYADDSDFADLSIIATVSVNSTAPATTITALQAQVAALTTQVAAMVTKKRFNKLARKWNAAFPSQKVALKK